MEIEIAEELAKVAMDSGIAEIEERHRKIAEDFDKKIEQAISNSSKRQTYIIKNKHIEAIKAIAYWERRKINDVAKDVFEFYINSYEHLNGKIQPKPSNIDE